MLRVFCARSMHVAVATLAKTFADTSSETPEITFEPMGALQARLAAGETVDVLILATPAIDQLSKAGALERGPHDEMVRAPIGVAIRAGASTPNISTPEEFKATLVAASAIALSDPAVGGSAGIYLRDLFARLGLADVIAAKTVRQKSGVAAADAVGRGEADLAMTFIPELLQGNGVRILGPLPPPYRHATGYKAAVSANSARSPVARAFVAALTAPQARGVWAAGGFEV